MISGVWMPSGCYAMMLILCPGGVWYKGSCVNQALALVIRCISKEGLSVMNLAADKCAYKLLCDNEKCEQTMHEMYVSLHEVPGCQRKAGKMFSFILTLEESKLSWQKSVEVREGQVWSRLTSNLSILVGKEGVRTQNATRIKSWKLIWIVCCVFILYLLHYRYRMKVVKAEQPNQCLKPNSANGHRDCIVQSVAILQRTGHNKCFIPGCSASSRPLISLPMEQNVTES